MSRRRLGQHYLNDGEVVRRIVAAAKIQPSERVLEIGTGRGALTGQLAALGRSFEGYEVDRENYVRTLEGLTRKGAKVHLRDAFRERPEFDVLVASLPYSKSSKFIDWVSQVDYVRGIVLLQEDFVAKVLAEPGTRDYRGVSALAQISSDIKTLFKVGRSSFSPPPRVNSVVVAFKPRQRLSKTEISRVKRLFSLRRREVVSALTKLGMPGGKEAFGKRRVYSLQPEEVMLICSD